MMSLFAKISWRELICLLVVALIVIILDYSPVSIEESWLFASAFMAVMLMRGKPFRQGVYFSLAIVIAVGFAGVLSLYPALSLYFIVSVLFFAAGIMTAPFLYVFLIIFLVATIAPVPEPLLLESRIMAVSTGCLVGYVCGQIILPVDMGKLFQRGLKPVLKSSLDLMSSVTMRLNHYRLKDRKIQQLELVLEQDLSMSVEGYPEWVYEAGFNPGLRAGFRYFLLKTERVLELLMAFNCIIDRINFHRPPDEVITLFNQSMQINEKLLNYVLSYIHNGELLFDASIDYRQDITLLEREVKSDLPTTNIALIDQDDYSLALIALIYIVKDIRKTLLQLAVTIR